MVLYYNNLPGTRTEMTDRTNLPASKVAGEQLLDYLMNDPKQQEAMNTWVKTQMIKYGITEEESAIENSAAYNLYYALTTEWHSKVLSQAILALVTENDPTH